MFFVYISAIIFLKTEGVDCMIKYKFDILERLKAAGYTTYKIRKEKLFSESTLQKFRKGETTITGENINSLCEALNIQPGDIIEYVPDDKEK